MPVLNQIRGVLVVALAMAGGFTVSSCSVVDFATEQGSGTIVSETRDVSGFDRIEVIGSGQVAIAVTGTDSLQVEADDNILPLLTTEVRNGKLELSSESSISPSQAIQYTITVESLTGVAVTGSGDVLAVGVDSDRFAVDISGSGSVSPAGATDALSVAISGSGRYRGVDLVAASASVDISGSGGAIINATDELDVDISGSGTVEYTGDPIVTQSISGSGAVVGR